MISLILLKLFTFSQILQGVPKLSHATVSERHGHSWLWILGSAWEERRIRRPDSVKPSLYRPQWLSNRERSLEEMQSVLVEACCKWDRWVVNLAAFSCDVEKPQAQLAAPVPTPPEKGNIIPSCLSQWSELMRCHVRMYPSCNTVPLAYNPIGTVYHGDSEGGAHRCNYDWLSQLVWIWVTFFTKLSLH